MTEQQTPTLAETGASMTDDSFIARIFTEARTHKAFLDRPVEESTLRQLYETAKFAPSASNLCPMRISFVTSAEAKQTVIAAAANGNKPKVESAPVVAIIAMTAGSMTISGHWHRIWMPMPMPRRICRGWRLSPSRTAGFRPSS